MTETADKDQSLVADSEFEQPLARVAYQPGMLLGLEATRSEQDYHRRRLNRHAYWLHGSGTVCGLRVYAQADDPGNADDQVLVRLFVTGGVAVDGLGREVGVGEPHCIDLTAWLSSQFEDENLWGALVRDGYDVADNMLWLKVTLRYQDCPSGLQPVLASAVNAGTDPVKPSRIKDNVLLELVAERPADALGERPFEAHNGLPALAGLVADKLNPLELDRLQAAAGKTKEQLELGARLLYALSEDNHALDARDQGAEAAARLARILLARIRIELATGADATPQLIVNPRRIAVDNLARNFLFNADLLAQLARTA
jgi:hypothetical protein